MKVSHEGDKVCFEVDNLDNAYSYSLSQANQFVDYVALDSAGIDKSFLGSILFKDAFATPLADSSKKTYSYGNTMLATDSNGNIIPAIFGRLDQNSGLCGKGTGIHFLQAESTACYVLATSDMSTLNVNNYKRNIKQGMSTDNVVTPSVLSTSFNTPTYDSATKLLRDAVSEVEYKITLKEDLTISSVTISLTTVSSVTLTNNLFLQKFKVGFYGLSSSKKSGNPGYSMGANLLLRNNNQLVTALTGIAIDGTCQVDGDTSTSISIPLVYGSDLQIRCNIPTSQLSNYCKSSALLKAVNSLTHIGIFGNSNLVIDDVIFAVEMCNNSRNRTG